MLNIVVYCLLEEENTDDKVASREIAQDGCDCCARDEKTTRVTLALRMKCLMVVVSAQRCR